MQYTLYDSVTMEMQKSAENSSNTIRMSGTTTPSYQDELLTYYDNSSTGQSVDCLDDEVEKTVAYLRENKEHTLIRKINGETIFEPGIINDTISYFNTLFSYGRTSVVMWVSKMFVDYYRADRIIKGLLYIAMYYSREFESLDSLMAMAAISNKNDEVKELAVRVLESNCNLTNYQVLLSLDVHEDWLKEYIDDVIKDFQKELCLS